MFERVFLSPAAEADIDEIVSYMAEENPVTAKKFLDALFDAFDKLTSAQARVIRENFVDNLFPRNVPGLRCANLGYGLCSSIARIASITLHQMMRRVG